MTKKIIHSAYGPKHKVVTQIGDNEAPAKQSFKDECDINMIMAKYQKTGTLSHLATHGSRYGFATSKDFRDCMETVKEAEALFAALPSAVRRKFGESPHSFLRFCENPENRTEAAMLGLLDENAVLPEVAPPDALDVVADEMAASEEPSTS